VLVLVGFMCNPWDADEGKVLAKTHPLFFTNMLGDCGTVPKPALRPYSVKEAESIGISEESLGHRTRVRGCTFLPRQFYVKLLAMLRQNPLLKGCDFNV
jgi:hypothetical protein